jgi:large subunit ribosomal protein L18
MAKSFTKQESRERRHNKVRAKVHGTSVMPRLSIFKSNKSIYAQVINDDKKETILALNSSSLDKKNNVETAKKTGVAIAKMILDKGIKAVVFDRGGYIYTGKIKIFADAVREGGVKF